MARYGTATGGRSDRDSRRSGSSRSRPGQPDRPGEAETKMRKAGVSERDIRRSSRGKAKVKPGEPDRPGEAEAKMKVAGVLTPEGKHKEITGYYKDPVTGTHKFVARGEPIPVFKQPAPAQPIQDPVKHVTPDHTARELTAPSMLRPDSFTSGTAYRPGVFDKPPVKPPGSSIQKWYDAQKTRLGIGGEREAKDYQSAMKEYEIARFQGTSRDLEVKERALQSKYAAYEKARGVSPLEKKKIPVEKTLASKAHRTAEKVRADRPSFKTPWQQKVALTINEAIAANIEFLGSAPTMVRHVLPTVVKEPSLLIPLTGVAAGGVIESLHKDPIQTAATMALTAGLIRGVTPKIKAYQPKPVKVFHKPPRVYVPMKVVKGKAGMGMLQSEAATVSPATPLYAVRQVKQRIRSIQRPRMPEAETIAVPKYRSMHTPVISAMTMASVTATAMAPPLLTGKYKPAQVQLMAPPDITERYRYDWIDQRTVQTDREKLISGFSPRFMEGDLDVIQGQKLDELSRGLQKQKQRASIPTPTITKTRMRPVPKRTSPKIPVPKKKPKKERKTRKQGKKAVAKQIINPIATLEQVMKRVTKM